MSSGFSLLTLNALNLEKVISKVRDKSYFRLQKTCRGLNEFIRTNKNISVNTKGHYYLEPTQDAALWEFQCILYLPRIPFEALYGTRLQILDGPAQWSEEGVERLCDLLKANRITCQSFTMLRQPGWTAASCAAVLNALKPEKVKLDSEGSSRFEALFQAKSLVSVDVRLDANNMAAAAQRILSTFQEVKISVSESPSPFDILHTSLQLLCSEPYPNLRTLEIGVRGDKDMPPADELMGKLGEGLQGRLRNFREEPDEEGEKLISIMVDLPSHFPRTSSCVIYVFDGSGYSEIVFCRE